MDSSSAYKVNLISQKKFKKPKDREHLLYLNDRLDQLINQNNNQSQLFLILIIKLNLKKQVQPYHQKM